MPKTIEISVLYSNFDVNVNVPSTYEEGDALVGETGGVLDGFISDCSARNFLPRLYAAVSKELVTAGHSKKVTGKSEPKKDGTTSDILESNIVHIGRIHTEGDDALKTLIGERLQAVASSIPFYSAAERAAGGGGKISQGAQDAANEFFSQGDDVVESKVQLIEGMVPAYKVARDAQNAVTPESLARGIQALQTHALRQAKAATAAALNTKA